MREDLAEAIEVAFEAGWTDGLPVVPPTRPLVDRVLALTDRDPADVVAVLPPRLGAATVEKVAINCVMAGCKPEYFPVVVAALEAMSDPRFSLRGVIASTHMGTPLIIVNGPVRQRLQINSGAGLIGPGFRANATIGRAVNLCLRNVGGSYPGTTNMSTFGQPGRFTMCFAENEEESPWEPLHRERGFAAEDSTVTVYPSASPQHLYCEGGTTPGKLTTLVADEMAGLGNVQHRTMGDALIVFSHETGNVFRDAGWKKADVRQMLFEKARKPIKDVLTVTLGENHRLESLATQWPKWLDPHDPTAMVPIVRRPENILVVFAGGAGGPHALNVPGWGSRAITRKIDTGRIL